MVQIEEGLFRMWHPSKTYIAQLELLMVLVALLQLAEHLRGRRGIWFIDNTAALMALVRGRSNSEDLDRLAGLIHAVLFAHRVWMYFEWVESGANWADGVSREGLRDAWHQRQQFRVAECKFPEGILGLPLGPMILIGQMV